MLKNWLKIAFVNSKNNWVSALINVLGIALGLSIFLLVYINWNDEKSYENWVLNKENIYFVENKNSTFGYLSSSAYPSLYVSKEKFPEIEDYTLTNIWKDYKIRLIAGKNSTYTIAGMSIDSFFKFFPYQKMAGNYENALSDEGKITLSEETAKSLFGKNYLNSIGKSVKRDDNGKDYLVTAIYRLPIENSVFRPGFIVKQENLQDNKDSWINYSYQGFFKLKPGTDVKNLESKLSKQQTEQGIIAAKKWGQPIDKNNKDEILLVPINRMKLDVQGGGIDKADKKTLQIMLALSALILLLSCINLINFKTAQASQRAKEVGIRKSIGGSRISIVLQFLLETIIICFVGLFIAFALVEILLPSYSHFLGKEISISGSRIYLISILITFLLALVSGIIPAIYLSDFRPINTLKGNFARSRHGIWLRNFILGLQLIISSFFIVCSIIIYNQVSYMMDKDLGFNGNQVLQVDFKKTNFREKDFNVKKYELLRNEVKTIHGVEDVTGSVLSIGSGYRNMSSVQNVVDTTKSVMNVGVGGIELNYFDFYKIKFLKGRKLESKYATDTISGAIANESFAKAMGWNIEQTIGKEVKPGWEEKKKYKIIGVVKDFYYSGVDAPVSPVLFFNYDRNWSKNNMQNLQIKVSANDIPGTIKRIQKFWETKAEPGYPFEYAFVDKTFAKTFERYQKQQTLFTILNLVVLLVALLGLFALSSLLIDQKLKDVAIKKALGASEKSIVFDLTKRFLLIAGIAVLISIPISYYFMNEWLNDFAYRIEMPWWPYLLSLVILLLLTFAVVSIKAYRATQVNLVKYLKYE